MGKPRLIILIRHAQSEGNKNRSIHQVIPDHRVKLTDEGWRQAEDAGRRLRHLLKPDDSLQIFTSPYRRTRETTEGILKTLTASSSSPEDGPSPFSRSKIKVYEEPRLREQDFGNFQPGADSMEKMWRERADYGHFFYRIPNGESAADAYDRVSGFNESLWRQFGDPDFPSVVVLVTHGLMSRVFLMKWYHWSVEYFEDLRNVNHCEFVIMKMNQDSKKYVLETQLRTWSELKRQRALERAEQVESRKDPVRRNTLSAFLAHPQTTQQPVVQQKREASPSLASSTAQTRPKSNEGEDHPLARQAPVAVTNDATAHSEGEPSSTHPRPLAPARSIPSYLTPDSHHHDSSTGRQPSGASTPHEMPSDDEDEIGDGNTNSYFPKHSSAKAALHTERSIAQAMRRRPERKPTPEDIERWVNESGMGRGKQADALGDEPSQEGPEDELPDQDGVKDYVEVMSENLERAEIEDRGLRGSVY